MLQAYLLLFLLFGFQEILIPFCEEWHFEIKIYCSWGVSASVSSQQERSVCVCVCVCVCFYIYLLYLSSIDLCQTPQVYTNTFNFSISVFVISSPNNQPVRNLVPIILSMLIYLLNPAIYTK